uniref:Synapsin ATP-binding domain-containing protein n=1 Tax=Anopheles atroparvus TaxID=41427 RepID=A0A182IJ69_ANOAO
MGARFTWQRFPCVLKAGHCHGGKATAKLDNPGALQDAAGLLCGTGLPDGGSYCSLEPYIDAKFDVHIQKIGTNYKAFMRKSISGNWKTNQGSAMLEQIPMTEKYKSWVDEVSELYGGMEVCGVAVIVSKDGKEFIINACDSTFPLMGDTQEEDRRQIADLVVGRMQNVCRPSMMTKAVSRSSISSRGTSPTEDAPPVPIGTRPVPVGGGPPPIPERTTPGVGSIGRHGSFSSQSGEPPEQPSERAPTLNSVGRRDSQASQSSTVSGMSSVSAVRSSAVKTAPPAAGAGPSVDLAKKKKQTRGGDLGDGGVGGGGSSGSVLSTRESSIDSVLVRPSEPPAGEKAPPLVSSGVEPSSIRCNGAPGQQLAQPVGPLPVAGGSVHKVNVSSLDGTNILASSGATVTPPLPATSGQILSSSAEPKRPAYDPTLSERINPFDKDKIVAGRSVTDVGAPGGTTTSSKIQPTHDDTDRYTIQQGIREQPSLTTGRFQATPAGGALGATVTTAITSPSTVPSAASSSSPSFSSSSASVSAFSSSSGYSSAASTGQSTPASVTTTTTTTPGATATADQKKQEFGRTKRASSDAEIIFGDRATDFYSKRFDRTGSRGEFRQRTESLTDAELIFGTSAVTGPPTPPVSVSPFSPAATGGGSSGASSTGATAGSHASRFGSCGSRDSTSFSSTTSDTDFLYGKRDPAVLTKSMSVASDRTTGATRNWVRNVQRDDDDDFDLK